MESIKVILKTKKGKAAVATVIMVLAGLFLPTELISDIAQAACTVSE